LSVNQVDTNILIVELLKIAIVFNLADMVEIAEFIIGYAKGMNQDQQPININIIQAKNGEWDLFLNKSTKLCSTTSIEQAESSVLLAKRLLNA
jgi:hypothetical protein